MLSSQVPKIKLKKEQQVQETGDGHAKTHLVVYVEQATMVESQPAMAAE